MKTEETENLELGEAEETTDEGIVEFTTREEYIGCAYNALAAIEGLDPMTKQGKARISRIRRKCLLILDSMVEEMFNELFEIDEDEE